jgi:hypothetical protein
MEKTFNDIRIHRPELAKAYLDLMLSQPGRPLALFAPRRVGKTFFLDQDMTPEAQSRGLLPIYVDVWLNKDFPLESINHALEEVLDDLTVPSGVVGKTAKTGVKKISVMGSGVEFGDTPQRRPLPEIPAFRFDALLDRVATLHDGKVLLMLDEVQTFGTHQNSIQLLSSLRAALTKHKDTVFAVFTGSSRGDLTRMFTTAGAPMYQYAQSGEFPFLGDRYLKAIAAHFSEVHPTKNLTIDALGELFARIGYKPALLKDIVKGMSAEGTTDCDLGFHLYLSNPTQVDGWNSILDSLDALERAMLGAIVQQKALMGQENIAYFEHVIGKKVTISKIRVSIDKLTKLKIITKNGAGIYIVDDELLAEFIKGLQQKT